MEQRATRVNRYYSQEFKKEVVELGARVGNSQAAKDLGIHESQVRERRKKFTLETTHLEKKSYEALEKEVNRLAKETMYLKEINKVLKKSTAIFSEGLLGDFSRVQNFEQKKQAALQVKIALHPKV